MKRGFHLTIVIALAVHAAPLIAAETLRKPEAPAATLPPLDPFRANGGFEIDLERPDRLTLVHGWESVRTLWQQHVAAARSSLTVVGGDFDPFWLEPLVRLRQVRPEVSIEVLVDRKVLGAQGEIADRLTAAGITVRFSTEMAALGGWPTIPALRGLVLLRDGQSLIFVTGCAVNLPVGSWLTACLVESAPAAKAHAARLHKLAESLPPYPEAKQILVNDQQ